MLDDIDRRVRVDESGLDEEFILELLVGVGEALHGLEQHCEQPRAELSADLTARNFLRLCGR